jgi:hypothetical protein
MNDDDDALASKENDSSSMACSRSDAGDGWPTVRPPLPPATEAEGRGLDSTSNELLAAGSTTPSPSCCGDGDAETGAKFAFAEAAAMEAAAAPAEGVDDEEGADDPDDAAAVASEEGTAVGPNASRVVVDCARDGG